MSADVLEVCLRRLRMALSYTARQAPLCILLCRMQVQFGLFVCLILFIFHCSESLAALGLSLVAANGGYSVVVVHGLLIVVISFVVEHGL